jgi:pyruvate dehydrogenase E2 component (dihydrolipoamide acetyltransferase)
MRQAELVEVILPRVDPEMREGTIIKWYKHERDCVKAGEPLFQMEAEKASIDIESPDTGRLISILVHEGSTVPVGTVVAIIEPDPTCV